MKYQQTYDLLDALQFLTEEEKLAYWEWYETLCDDEQIRLWKKKTELPSFFMLTWKGADLIQFSYRQEGMMFVVMDRHCLAKDFHDRSKRL